MVQFYDKLVRLVASISKFLAYLPICGIRTNKFHSSTIIKYTVVLGKHCICSVREILLELGDAGSSQRMRKLDTLRNIVEFYYLYNINFQKYKCEMLLIISSFLQKYNNQCIDNVLQELSLHT